jgi:hypothetical protein
MPKIQELVRELREACFGRPGEQISYRDYWTFKQEGKKWLEEKGLGLTAAPRKENYEEQESRRQAPTKTQR